MNKTEKIELIRATGIVAIMRARTPDGLIPAADALCQGGVRVIEVTLTTPGALDVISKAVRRYEGQGVLFGAGSVLDPSLARAAISAGAGFIVTPVLDPEVIALCRQQDIPVLPGCFTPTEIWAAWKAGADMIKVFPADIGGAGFIRAVLAPLPQLQIVPVGGVNLDTALDYISSGAVALGVGHSLVSQQLLDAGDMAELTRRAAAFIQAVRKGRGGGA